MISPREAVEKAHKYLEDVIPDFAALRPKVEGIERSSDSSVWKVTFSAQTSDDSKFATLTELLRYRRIEKVVSVSTEDGALVAVANPFPVSIAS
jgi:hypothetical protein